MLQQQGRGRRVLLLRGLQGCVQDLEAVDVHRSCRLVGQARRLEVRPATPFGGTVKYILVLQAPWSPTGRRRGRRGGGRHRRADPGPTDVSLSNWTVRPSSGCSVVLATHTAGVSVDGYTLTLAANPWNIVRTYNLTPGRELFFACRYRLGTASNFVVYMSEPNNVYDPLCGSFESALLFAAPRPPP